MENRIIVDFNALDRIAKKLNTAGSDLDAAMSILSGVYPTQADGSYLRLNGANISLKSVGGTVSAYNVTQAVQGYRSAIKRLGNHSRSLSSAVKQASASFRNTEKERVPSQKVGDSPFALSKTASQSDGGTKTVAEVISKYEKKHPKDAEEIENFLSKGRNNNLTDEDVQNIKYLIYTAPEPYRSIYINSLKKYKIGDAGMNNGAFYRLFFHTVNYTYPDSFGNDPRGAYTTFFHECGHAIDDLSNESKWWGSDTENFTVYSDAMGRKVQLREAIVYDVYYNKDNPHSVTSIAEQIIQKGGSGSRGNVDNVIKAFESGNTSDLSNADLMLYNAVVNEHKRTTGFSAQYEAVSDVYGGVSHNALRTGYGHDAAYWDNQSKAGCELWAEYFSYNMAGDQQNLRYLEEYFPEASKVLSQYADALND